jgi:hypothetical protein
VLPKLSLLERLEQAAFEDGIAVYNYRLSEAKKSGCYCNGDIRAIAMDKARILSTAEETVLLAEEVGHYKTDSLYSISATYNTAIERTNRIKCEAEAKRWAIKKVLPASKIKRAIKQGAVNDFEVAEYCNVTLDFLQEAFAYYRVKKILFN